MRGTRDVELVAQSPRQRYTDASETKQVCTSTLAHRCIDTSSRGITGFAKLKAFTKSIIKNWILLTPPTHRYPILYYNTGFSYVTNNVHCGMAQVKLTWQTLRLRRKSALNKIKIILFQHHDEAAVVTTTVLQSGDGEHHHITEHQRRRDPADIR